MKHGTPKGVKYRSGDRVLVGGGGFGRPLEPGTVAQDWDGESLVMVVPDGRTKPRPVPASRLRHEKARPPEPSVGVVRPSTTTASTRAVPRPRPPARDPKYLAWVREQPCCACQRRELVEAHHWAPRRGMAQKVSDYRTVPLCEECHRHFHDTGCLRALDVRTTREVFARVQAHLMDEWLSEKRAKARERG